MRTDRASQKKPCLPIKVCLQFRLERVFLVFFILVLANQIEKLLFLIFQEKQSKRFSFHGYRFLFCPKIGFLFIFAKKFGTGKKPLNLFTITEFFEPVFSLLWQQKTIQLKYFERTKVFQVFRTLDILFAKKSINNLAAIGQEAN